MTAVEFLEIAIIQILVLKGDDIFENSKLFCIMMDDLLPKLVEERKVFCKALKDSKILKKVGNCINNGYVNRDVFWSEIGYELLECGVEKKWCNTIVLVFSNVLEEVSYIKDRGEDTWILFKQYQELSIKGNTDAQYMLGDMYRIGKDVKQDYKKAIYWYEKASTLKLAQAYLGILYFEEKDYKKAYMWLQKAADQGIMIAQYTLAQMFYYGYGIDVDYEKTLKYLQDAAEQQDAAAQCNLGVLYEEGYITKKDKMKAFYWYERAVKQGYIVDRSKFEPFRVKIVSVNNESAVQYIQNLKDELGIKEKPLEKRSLKKQLAYAITHMTLTANTGNIIISKDANIDAVRIAKELMKKYKSTGSLLEIVGIIKGKKLNNKNLQEFLKKLNNGGLIIEEANGMSQEKLGELVMLLSENKLGIIVIIEDLKEEISRLLNRQTNITYCFDIKIELDGKDNLLYFY